MRTHTHPSHRMPRRLRADAAPYCDCCCDTGICLGAVGGPNGPIYQDMPCVDCDTSPRAVPAVGWITPDKDDNL